MATRTLVGALLFSSPSQTLRLTPLTSALRAARAHGAVLRIYPDLPLRFIKIHGDILVQCIKRIAFILYSYSRSGKKRMRLGDFSRSSYPRLFYLVTLSFDQVHVAP